MTTIHALLEQRASSHADVVFIRTRTEEATFKEVQERVERSSAALAARGVRPTDTVASFLVNSVDAVVAWIATCRIGAVYAPLNRAMKGPAREHALAIVEPRLIIDGPITGAGAAVDAHASAPLDLAFLLFTSGTTGRSKGCMLSHRFALRQAELLIEHLALRETDVLFSPFPLHHLDAAVLTVMPALVLGTTAALTERFSASRFWDDVRALGATVFDFMGATIAILDKQPPHPDDARNPARLGWGVPMPACAEAFERRFGVTLVELYGSTDAGLPIFVPRDEPRRLGSCGKAVSPYDVRLSDVGELLVRATEPGVMSDGYYRMPEETAASRPDGWFHTGDLLRQDEDGWFWFVGRRAEVIRRRGENISAFEIEEAAGAHPAVLECAAFAVPSELSEDDVMLAVVPRPGLALAPATVAAWCAEQMAPFMVPRYIDVVESLPKTPTEKVAKHELSSRGVTSTTWERP